MSKEGKKVLLEIIFEGADRTEKMQHMTNSELHDFLRPFLADLEMNTPLYSVVEELMRRLEGGLPWLLVSDEVAKKHGW